MELKVILLFIIVIKSIESKKPIRSYVITVDKRINLKTLPGFTVTDSTRKKVLYTLNTTSTDIDTIILSDYQTKKMLANVEGEWRRNIFQVTFSIYDTKLDKWQDGDIKQVPSFPNYRIIWNTERAIIKYKLLSRTRGIYNEYPQNLLADFRYRTVWTSGTRYIYDLKIYSNYLPDILHILALAVVHHTDNVLVRQNN